MDVLFPLEDDLLISACPMVVLPEGIGAGVGVGAGVGGASVVQGTCTNGGRSVVKVAFGAARSVLLFPPLTGNTSILKMIPNVVMENNSPSTEAPYATYLNIF